MDLDAMKALLAAVEADAAAARKRVRELVDEVAHQAAKVPQTIQAYDDRLNDMEARAERAEAEVARLTDDFAALVADARAEAEKAMRKFPQPNYVISKIAEEAGEVVKAAIHCAEGRETADNLRGEMKQCIAMLYRLWVEGDGVHGLPPVRAALRTEGE